MLLFLSFNVAAVTSLANQQAIRHFHISHNAPYLPPKILHNLCFSFLLGFTAVPREIENNAYSTLPSFRTLKTKARFLRRPFQLSVNKVFRMKAEISALR